MTLVASILFLVALALSFFAISKSIGDAAPRIAEVIEDALGPQSQKQRVVTTAAPRIQLAAMPRPVNAVSFRRAAHAQPAILKSRMIANAQPARLAA